MDSSMSLALTENLLALEQTASSFREDISKSKRMVCRYRPISFFFSTYTKDPAHPDKWAESLMAKEFRDRADIEERFVASSLQHPAEMDRLKQRC